MERRTTAYLCLGSLLLIVGIECWVFSMELNNRVKAMRLHIYAIFQFIVFLSVWYIWRRVTHLLLSKELLSFSTVIKVGLFVILGLAQSTFVIVVFWTIRPDPLFVARVSSTCLGIVALLSSAMMIADLISFLLRKLFCKCSKEVLTDKTEMKIRMLLSLFGALALIYAGSVGISKLEIERIKIPIKGLNPGLNGTTIVQLSDIHLGPFNGQTALSKLLAKANELNPDVVVITGDLVDASVVALREIVKPLASIRSKHGVYFSTGNHEYYTGDVDSWLQELPKLNVNPLVNERVCLLSKEPQAGSCPGGFYLAGLEDYETRMRIYGAHSMDLHRALSGRDKGVPTVVMAHQPRAAAEAVMWDDVRLVLSGHTHAGQIFPWNVAIYLGNPFFVGLYEPLHGVFVYVSPGSMFYLIPFRHYRPEITHITLISS